MQECSDLTLRASIQLWNGVGAADTLDLKTLADCRVQIRVRGINIIVFASDLRRAVNAVTSKG